MKQQLQNLLERRVMQCVSDKEDNCSKIKRKKSLLSKRNAEMIKVKATGKVRERLERDQHTDILYDVHFSYLIKQRGKLYIEEEIEKRKATFYKDSLMTDDERLVKEHSDGNMDLKLDSHDEDNFFHLKSESHDELERIAYHYDRRRAVQYAERWWNEFNPQFQKFTDDCTNYISQCLYAGGAPMRGFPNRSSGWWYRGKNWSYSWSIANSLRWYLATSKVGLRAKEVSSPDELQLGDVICYDFQGDGRFDHNTIVTGKDYFGMPLVNAHTYNSRMRYWSYEDSSAYTKNIQYKFYTIIDG